MMEQFPEAIRDGRPKLERGNVYCHRCSGRGREIDAQAEFVHCSLCRGTGQLARERHGDQKWRPVILPHGAAITGVGIQCSSGWHREAISAVEAKAGESESDERMECRMAVSVEGAGDLMVMPGGVHKITATRAGEPVTVTIAVGPEAASSLQSALEAHQAAGPQKPYFDFDHSRGPASAWPTSFEWRNAPRPGVYAKVEWSKAGKDAIEGRMYRAFSPTFFTDRSEPARVTGAPLNMGSLVNEPAFQMISPLWASGIARDLKDRGYAGTEGNEGTKESMAENTELAALQAKYSQLEKENGELKAKASSSAHADAISAKDGEIGGLKTEVTTLKAKLAERAKTDAKLAVEAAVARGAIPPKDEALQAKWRGLIESDPTHAELLGKLPGNPALQTVTTASSGGGGGAHQATGTEAEQFASAVKAKAVELKDKSKALDAVIGESPKLYQAWREANGKPGIF